MGGKAVCEQSIPLELDQMKTNTMRNGELGEPDAHVMMRHARMVLRLLLIVALIATTLLLIFFRQAAYLAAIPVPVLLFAYVIVSVLEKQSRAEVLRCRNQLVISQEEVDMDIQYAGIYTAMGLIALFALSTFIVAATITEDWSMVGTVAAILFLLSVLILFPYIPLFMIDAAHHERDKLQEEKRIREESQSE